MIRHLPTLLAALAVMLGLAGCPGKVVQEDPCAEMVCESPPADHCDGNVLVTYESEGACVETAEGPECVYESTRHDCGDEECREEGGVVECVPAQTGETCEDIEPCEHPPADYCDEDVLVVYAEEGVCVEDDDGARCVYEVEEVDCAADELACVIEEDEASCVDLCAGVTCPARDDECDGDAVVVYGGASGECDFRTGECVYPPEDETRIPCGDMETCKLDENGDPHCVEIVLTCPDDCMVLVDETYCIDRYEASRPDATEAHQGSSDEYAVCAAGVMPWYSGGLTGEQAEAACEAAGKRLCTVEEWENVCTNRGTTAYPYGDDYDPVTCNGIDTFCRCDSEPCADVEPCPFPGCFRQGPDGDSAGACGADWGVWPTGTVLEGADECVNEDGIFDVSGNVWEAVLDPDADPDQHEPTHQFRGGACNCIDSAALHRCSFVAYSYNVNIKGFRCCADPIE